MFLGRQALPLVLASDETNLVVGATGFEPAICRGTLPSVTNVLDEYIT